MLRDKHTIAGLFRTAKVLERADYVVVNMCDDEWSIVKARGYKFGDIIDTYKHNELLMETNQPIVLDHEYLATDEHGQFILGY